MLLGFVHLPIIVILRCTCALPTVLIDHVRVQQVVLNLVRNSIDASSDDDTRTISVATVREGDMVEVVVGDNGSGLPEEVRERVFEPFGSTRPDGIGIGLSICRAIVEAHGGKITVDTGPKRGAGFRFSVPVFDAS